VSINQDFVMSLNIRMQRDCGPMATWAI